MPPFKNPDLNHGTSRHPVHGAAHITGGGLLENPQIAAVRDLVLATRAGSTAEEVAGSFKNGRAGSAESVLDSLAAVGLVVRYEKNGERMWKAAGRGNPRKT